MAKDLDYFKKKIMAILSKQEKEENATPEINKSLNDIDYIYNQMNPDTFGEIEKARGYGIGTVREWKGRKYKKIAPNKWRLVYESNSRGAKQSIAYLKKAVMAAKTTDELLEIVMQNVNRFTDANGKTLDIVSELQEAVKSAKTALNGNKTPSTPKTEPKAEEKKESSKEPEETKLSPDEKQEVKDRLDGLVRMNIGFKGYDGALSAIKEGKVIEYIRNNFNPETRIKMDAFVKEEGKTWEEVLTDSFDRVKKILSEKKEEPKETPKTEEKPAETPKKDNNEAVKADMNKWKGVFDKYYNDHNTGVGHWLDWVERPGQQIDSKAFGKQNAIRNLIKMRDELKNDYGIDTPEIPQEIIDKYNEYNEIAAGQPRYMVPWESHKILSSLKNSKLRDAFNAIMQPVKDKYFEAKNQLVLEAIPDKVEPVAGKTNDEHAELFEMKGNPNNSDEKILFYNGKPYGNDGNRGYGYSNSLADQREMVRAVGMDPLAQAKYVFDKFNNNKDEVAYQWSLDSAIKKYGEEKLKKLAQPSMSDEEFMEKFNKLCQEKTHTYKWMAEQARNHVYNKMVEETAKKYLDKLTGAQSAINDVDIPVDPADMDEAISIIGRDVDRILSGRDVYGNTKQGLPDKIRRRVRNDPGVARAMFVYIKQKQEETGKTVFTPKHSIWDEFAKLNENAMQSALNGESETKGGTSGNMYKGDGISSVVEDKDAGRYQITFTGKPDYDTRTILKQHGFRWAPSLGVWQCFNTQHGENSLRRVAEKLGWEKDAE